MNEKSVKKLMMDLVERFGEETQLDMIANRSLQLALSIQEYKKVNIKEDYSRYVKSYNDVCEKLGYMKLMMKQAEFLFNGNSIEQSFETESENLSKSLNHY